MTDWKPKVGEYVYVGETNIFYSEGDVVKVSSSGNAIYGGADGYPILHPKRIVLGTEARMMPKGTKLALVCPGDVGHGQPRRPDEMGCHYDDFSYAVIKEPEDSKDAEVRKRIAALEEELAALKKAVES